MRQSGLAQADDLDAAVSLDIGDNSAAAIYIRRMIDKQRSKRLSYWLRHAPEKAGLELDEAGWACATSVLQALEAARLPTSGPDLHRLVATNDKQRFELSSDGHRIRARQGHSVAVQGEWPIASPPETLFHGTVERFLPSIRDKGLLAGARHHVHLSPTIETARAVGSRRGRPIVLSVAAATMVHDGFTFRLASNGVWLIDQVPPAYLREVS